MEARPPIIFSDWIRQRRRFLDLTRAELAQSVGCSVSALRKIESGERRPSKQLAGLLAKSLEIPPEDLSSFLRVARGELNLERLHLPSYVPVHPPIQRPTPVSAANHLPVQLTPLVGRDAELAVLGRLLQDPDCRLLALVGSGGTGKTRLAIEAASRNQDLFPDGVWFVPLASHHSATFLVESIADALGFSFQGQAAPRSQLLNYMIGKQVLLVLDNLEHLLEGVGLLAEILERAPQVKLLATSRERLNLRGEWVFEVQGLPVPPVDLIENAEAYSAVVLFVQTAQRAKASFELRGENRPAVVRICQLIEGMPLGIELAAAWVSVLSCQEIAQEIENSLDFLATSRRDVPERQRSLRAVFDHSWSLLSEEECRLVNRLGIFRGGFEREAAEQVAGASLPLLLALASKSLVHRTESGRYGLHDLLRKYARTKLEESPEELEKTQELHCIYYLDFFGDRQEDLRNERQLQVMAEIRAEMENIRAAWHHAVAHGRVEDFKKPIKSYWFYDICGWFQEAESVFRWTVEELDRITGPGEKADPGTIITREHIRANLGWFCIRLGKFDESRKLLYQSLASLRSYGAHEELMNALHHMGALERLAGNYDLSYELFLELLHLATRIDARWYIALAHGNMGLAKLALGGYQEAYTRLHTANTIFREAGDRRILAVGLQFLGDVLRNLGEYVQSKICLYESLEISKIFGDRWISGLALNQLGLVNQALGEYTEAVRLFRESLALLKEIDEFWGMLRSLNNLGAVYLALGAYAEARSAFREALSIAGDEQILPEALDALIGMAHISMEEQDFEGALSMELMAINHPLIRFESKARAERLHTDLQARLTPQQVEAAQAWRHRITLQEAISEVIKTGSVNLALKGFQD